MSEKKKYVLRVGGRFVNVNRDCYKLFYKARRREKYLLESDELHGKVSYHALDTEDYSGEEIIRDAFLNPKQSSDVSVFDHATGLLV